METPERAEGKADGQARFAMESRSKALQLLFK